MNINILSELKVKIYADCGDKAAMLALYHHDYVRGFTTNPSLMYRSGVSDYKEFACSVIREIPDRPISFEIIADDFDDMERQANEIASWGANVYVKVPVTNTRGQLTSDVLRRVARRGIKLNVTAVMTLEQIREVAGCLVGGTSCIISVFAGRIADTGRDPIPSMKTAAEIVHSYPNLELMWASSRELLNIFQADEVGCDIITVTSDIVNKLYLVGRDLSLCSLDTVAKFYDDARAAGLRL